MASIRQRIEIGRQSFFSGNFEIGEEFGRKCVLEYLELIRGILMILLNSASAFRLFFTILRGMFFPRDESFQLFLCYFAS